MGVLATASGAGTFVSNAGLIDGFAIGFRLVAWGILGGMNRRGHHHRWLVSLLLVALVALPMTSLYAQSVMLTGSGMEREFHHEFSQFDEQHAKECCQQDQSQCRQSCGDCFHCGTLHAVISMPVLAAERPGLDYAPPTRNNHTSLIPSGQFRPPRLII